jgi:redox-sensitive bicupin YhaK (pirin superfamily)
MHVIRRAADRGHTLIDWLDSRHSFSFGEYYDPRHMGFGPLRVINDDRVRSGGGFGTHPHANMEIVTYVVSGALAHRDSLGNGSVIEAGDVQRMTAGTGIRHSEFNARDDEDVHFLQIWILPEKAGLTPSYEQKRIEPTDGFRLIASRDGRDGSVTVHQTVDLYAGHPAEGVSLAHRFAAGRVGWLQVVKGRLDLDGETLEAGDGVAFDGGEVAVEALSADVDVLLFDMAP